MAGVITAGIAIGVLASIAVLAAIVAAVSTVSGYGKPAENDED